MKYYNEALFMERILKISENRAKQVTTKFYRYLYHNIDWNQPLIIIKGARGTGKTTLLLQRIKEEGEGIYLSLDDLYFELNRLILLVEELYKKGERTFYFDEIHQYPYWAKDLKNLYDNYPDIKMIATGSSAIRIENEQADLSRRAVTYTLYGLSFREFLNLEFNQNFEKIKLQDLLKEHSEISTSINDLMRPLTVFEQYLEFGYYPFFISDKKFYSQKIEQIVRLITEIDLPAVENISYSTVRSMKGLFYVISQSVSFIPNIQKLANKMGIPRNSVLKALDLLEKGGVINLLRSDTKGISYLQKPEKIYLENTNLAYVFSGGTPNKGNLRETFFFNQLKVANKITSSRFSDFFVDDHYTFEIGGAAKTNRQIKDIPQAYIAADEIENGQQNKIPLWLFGFLY